MQFYQHLPPRKNACSITTSDRIHCYERDGNRTIYYLTHDIDVPESASEASHMICYILSQNLANRYTLFILFDRILSTLMASNSNSKILLLKYLHPSLLCSSHALRYINALIPALSNTNNTICIQAKNSLNSIVIFNNYLCFNSLNLIIQVLIKYIHDYTYEVLDPR